MRKILFFIIILVITGCDFGNTDKIMDEETYETVFLELAILDQYEDKLLPESSKEEFREEIFEHYGVTSEQFRISHEHYQSQVEKQLERIDRIAERIRAERDKVNEAERKLNQLDEEGLDSLRQVSRNR